MLDRIDREDAYRGVWVYIEHRDGHAAEVSWELLSPGRALADALGVDLSAVIIGDRADHLSTEAFAYGADTAHVVEAPVFRPYRTETHLRAMIHLIMRHRPEIVLLGATVTGRDLASAVAVELGTGLTADCTHLEIAPASRTLRMIRPAYGGNILATIECAHHRPQMATVRPRVMARPTRVPRAGRVARDPLNLDERDVATKILSYIPTPPSACDLADAAIVVGVGRGIGGPEHLALATELAGALGGVVGASRAVIDRGWLSTTHLIGQSGKVVRPRLYIALGISGAVQHLAGMQGAQRIIAINRDPAAAIFTVADVGIVGDLFTLVPAIMTHLRSREHRALAHA